ncbi:MAG: hypothetical protein AAFX90_19520 [Pseudomonadota bacterium]
MLLENSCGGFSNPKIVSECWRGWVSAWSGWFGAGVAMWIGVATLIPLANEAKRQKQIESETEQSRLRKIEIVADKCNANIKEWIGVVAHPFRYPEFKDLQNQDANNKFSEYLHFVEKCDRELNAMQWDWTELKIPSRHFADLSPLTTEFETALRDTRKTIDMWIYDAVSGTTPADFDGDWREHPRTEVTNQQFVDWIESENGRRSQAMLLPCSYKIGSLCKKISNKMRELDP